MTVEQRSSGVPRSEEKLPGIRGYDCQRWRDGMQPGYPPTTWSWHLSFVCNHA